jgi:hypothetical protein
MTDDLRERYGAGASERRSSTPCPTPEQLLAAAQRGVDENALIGLLSHVGECSVCRREFEILRALTGARQPAPVVRRWRTFAIAASAVIVAGAATMVWRFTSGEDREPVFRSGKAASPASDSVILLRSPVTLSWQRDTNAERYQLEVLDPTGRAMFSAPLRDTVIVLPDSLRLTAGSTYSWWVRTERTDGTIVQSPFTRFRVAPR